MMKPGNRDEDSWKFDPPQTQKGQDQEQHRGQQRQRQEQIGCSLEHRTHQIDVHIVMWRVDAELRVMNLAIVTVHGDQRLTAVEAEMQVVSDQPQRQERNACDQCYGKTEAVGGTH